MTAATLYGLMTNNHPIRPKGDGRSIMVSAFLCECHGLLRLSDDENRNMTAFQLTQQLLLSLVCINIYFLRRSNKVRHYKSALLRKK